jgi:hypothetical protein
MESAPPPLAALLDQIVKSIKAELYFPALSLCVTLPDICTSIEADPEVAFHENFDTYCDWFDRFAAPCFKELQGADCYYLRGGVVHSGHFRHKKSRFDRIIFFLPGPIGVDRDVVVTIADDVTFSGKTREEITGSYPKRQSTGKVLQVDLLQFCDIMMGAASRWAREQAENPHVIANLPNLVRVRDGGFPPFMVGNIRIVA